jgi:RND family efflux transporter MFP subunit
MKKKSIIIGICALIILLIIIEYSNDLIFSDKSNTEEDWKLVKVIRQDLITSVVATGVIKPMVGAEVKVGSRISGVLKHLYVNIGDRVEKGQLLAELDPVEFEAQYNQALATLEKAKADLEYSKLDLERKNELVQKKLTSQNEVDIARNSFMVAQAQVKSAQANVEFANIQLSYTLIYAPISGVVASVSTQVGETVAAAFASPTFVTIIDLARLEVWAYVDETDIGRVKENQKAFFTVDTYPDIEFEAIVIAIYPKAEIVDNVVNYITIMKITDKKGQILRPEMTTNINIFLDAHRNVLTVPNKAIRREAGKKFVYISESDRVVQRNVKAGIRTKYYTEILEGIKDLDLVIIGNVNKKL